MAESPSGELVVLLARAMPSLGRHVGRSYLIGNLKCGTRPPRRLRLSRPRAQMQI
jgi:hypothetical protein